MTMFTELKQQLTQQLNSLKAEKEIIELRAEVPFSVPCHLLNWLKAQSHFPQSFWQSRDQDLAYATIGVTQQFDCLDNAQEFSQKYGVRLFGGVKFEGECHFILPKVVLAKNAEKLTACLYVDCQQLTQEKILCSEMLNSFDQLTELSSFSNHLLETIRANDFAHWQHNIEQAVSAIHQKKFRKVVLANATTLTFEDQISAYDLLFASQQKNLGCYHFLWSEQQGEAFIGSSPERLYQRQDRQLETEALAGTVAVTDDPIQTEKNGLWLLNDPKNTHENQLVVDDIQQHLADCVSDFQVSPIELKRLHNVQHLRRQIRATLQADVSDVDCLLRIHPTAAVAGLPRRCALPFIAENEGFTRGWYAGTLGTFTPNHAEFCVALRSAKIEQNQITLYAGAGIIDGSEAQSEWNEIERKKIAMETLLLNHR